MPLEENPTAARFENVLFSRWTEPGRRRLTGGGEKIFAGVYEGQVRLCAQLSTFISNFPIILPFPLDRHISPIYIFSS